MEKFSPFLTNTIPLKVNEEDKIKHFSIYMSKHELDGTTKITKGVLDYIKDISSKLKPAFKNLCVDGGREYLGSAL